MAEGRGSCGIGVFGGTFDPPHIGHLVAASHVAHELRVDRVLLVVAGEPWQKAGLPLSAAADRLAMVAAAVEGVEGLEASALEVERGGPSYTADTLAALTGASPGVPLYLVLGSDAAAGLGSWERVDEVRRLARLVVVTRPGAETAGVPLGWEATTVVIPRLEVSSTDLRARVVDGRPLRWLVPDPVVTIIEERGLYAPRR